MAYRDSIQIKPFVIDQEDVAEDEKIYISEPILEQNQTNLARLIGKPQMTGKLDFEDNGSSNVNCKIRIKKTNHGSGYLDDEDYVIIADNTAAVRIWRVKAVVDQGEPYYEKLDFTDSNLLTGTTSLEDYDQLLDGSNDLWIWVVRKKYLTTWITKNEILLKKTSATGGPQAVNDDAIPSDVTWAGSDPTIKDALDKAHAENVGSFVLLNTDETQASGTSSGDAKTYNLPVNTYTKIRVNTDGFIKITGISGITDWEKGVCMIEIKDDTTTKAYTEGQGWIDTETQYVEIPFSLTTTFQEQSAKTLKITITITNDTHITTTYYVNRMEVVGIW